MRRFSLILICLLLAFATAPLLAEAVPNHGSRKVSFPVAGETIHGLLYQPAGLGPFPAILVIHEWWGLNSWVKEQASRFADQGYVTLAVDLYRGQVATDPETAHELMRGLPQNRGIADLIAGVDYLKTLKIVNPRRIGAVGWCMGGNFAMQLAIAKPSLRAVAINYGAPETDPAQLKKINAAILGNFGALDRGITPADVHAFAASMQKIGHPVDVKEYADAGHAFQNPANKSGYRAADAADANLRMKEFFRHYLKN